MLTLSVLMKYTTIITDFTFIFTFYWYLINVMISTLEKTYDNG